MNSAGLVLSIADLTHLVIVIIQSYASAYNVFCKHNNVVNILCVNVVLIHPNLPSSLCKQ